MGASDRRLRGRGRLQRHRRAEGGVMRRGAVAAWMLAGTVTLALALAIGVAVGPVSIGMRATAVELLDRLPWVSVRSGLDDRAQAILWNLRAPRVVLGALVGATLGISGAAYQGVFRNPLADPYLLGAA